MLLGRIETRGRRSVKQENYLKEKEEEKWKVNYFKHLSNPPAKSSSRPPIKAKPSPNKSRTPGAKSILPSNHGLARCVN